MYSDELGFIKAFEKLVDNNNREFLENSVNVTLKISPREASPSIDHITPMGLYDHYCLDFEKGTLTWKGCTYHPYDYVIDANYVIEGSTDTAPPQGEMTLAEFSKYQR